MRSGVSFRQTALIAVLSISVGASGAAAQVGPFTGYELALDGSSQVRAGAQARFFGVAYRVRGLSELVPYAGRVRARFARAEGDESGAWVTTRSDADGRFVVEVPIPPISETFDSPRIEIEVGPADSARRFTQSVHVQSAMKMMFRSDRQLYEQGEPAHVFVLLTDVASGRPLADQRVALAVSGSSLADTHHVLETGPSGVAHLVLPIPDEAPAGHVSLDATIEGQLSAHAGFRVGTRTWERLLVRVAVAEDEVPPGGTATVVVDVTTPSGAPVENAELRIEVAGRGVSARTNDEGRAEVPVSAPAYHRDDTSVVYVHVSVTHPAHGSADAMATLRLAVPLSLSVEVIAPHGGLVPEVDDVLYVRLSNGAGQPPPVGTEIRVEGPAIRGGAASARTDVHGFAQVPVRLPLGAASSGGDMPETPLLVHIRGPLERTAATTAYVIRHAELAATLDRVVAEPGGVVEVRLARRRSATRAPVLVTLVDERGEPLVITHVRPGQNRVRLDLPADRLGLLYVVVRTVEADESFDGPGTVEPLIVRPARPDFITLTPERERWVVGETARVSLTTDPAAGPAYGAVLVRDLSAHGGEVAFTRRYLEGAFGRAVLDPTTPDANRLLRAALAAHASPDYPAPTAPPLVDALGLPSEEVIDSDTSGLLRDPWPLRRELERRGVAEAMQLVETRLSEALDAGALDEVTVGRGPARRFRNDLLDPEDGLFQTLGGGDVTPAILGASDPSFSYDNVARRVARTRLVGLMVALAAYLDPGDDASPAARMAAREPSERWLPRMVERGHIDAAQLADPWGGQFQLRRAAAPTLVLSARATGLELVSPGPDGRPGTRDDVRDPFARAVPRSTPYAVASGEDALMRALATLSPLAATLEAIRESYRRISAEMTEEDIGDAVAAEVSEGTIGLGSLGLIGHGAGGGGSGYGSGAGGFGRRSARAPRVRAGMASVSGLAGIVRERFPPTLLFVPTLDIDASGTTTIDIPLADTVTTYLVEAIVWRDDGWVWSESTRIEVDRDIVVDAPIPQTAHRGDRVRLPLRVSNRGASAREIVVRLVGDASLGIADSEPHALTLAPGAATAVPLDIALTRVGEGQLTVVATTPDGEAIDAVRRPIRVVALARRVTAERRVVAEGEAEATFVVPAGADARAGSVTLTVGPAVFGRGLGERRWASWSPPTTGFSGSTRVLHHERSPVPAAFALGTAWSDGATGEREVSRQTLLLASSYDRVAQNLERQDASAGERLRFEAWMLLGLAPVAQAPEARAVVEAAQLLSRLRDAVADRAVALSDDPEGWVLAAAALGFSATGDESDTRIAELVRRLRPHAVVVGQDRWLATERRAVRSTLLWAMAELSLGHRAAALGLLSTVGRWAALGHMLAADERGLASATTSRLLRGQLPERAEVVIDGRAREVVLHDGSAAIDAPELARPGTHRVIARAAGDALMSVATSARYGVSWRRASAEPGPYALDIEGDIGAVDRVAELELVVRNRTPRTLPQPIVEIELPSGAELTARDRTRIAQRAREVSTTGGVLRVRLPPLPPGAERRLPMPLRWSIDGRLRGLGVAAWAEDRPRGVTIRRPRMIDLSGGGR